MVFKYWFPVFTGTSLDSRLHGNDRKKEGETKGLLRQPKQPDPSPFPSPLWGEGKGEGNSILYEI